MGWEDIPDLPGLAQAYTPSPIPLRTGRRRFRPEVELLRREAESRFQTEEEVENYLAEEEAKLGPREDTASRLASLAGALTDEPASLNPVDQQRKARIQAQATADREARLEAARAETTSPIELINRAGDAGLGAVQDAAATVAGEYGAAVGRSRGTTGERERRLTSGAARLLVPGSTEEGVAELAAGPTLKVAGKGASLALKPAAKIAGPAVRRGAAALASRIATSVDEAAKPVDEELVEVFRGTSSLSKASDNPFYTTNPDLAQSYADGAVRNFGGEPIVESVKVPKSQLKADDIVVHNGKMSKNYTLLDRGRRLVMQGETGAVRMPGGADDVPDDVARLAFGDEAAEAVPVGTQKPPEPMIAAFSKNMSTEELQQQLSQLSDDLVEQSDRLKRGEYGAQESLTSYQRDYDALKSELDLRNLLDEYDRATPEQQLEIAVRTQRDNPQAAAQLKERIATRADEARKSAQQASSKFYRDNTVLRNRASRLSSLVDDVRQTLDNIMREGEHGGSNDPFFKGDSGVQQQLGMTPEVPGANPPSGVPLEQQQLNRALESNTPTPREPIGGANTRIEPEINPQLRSEQPELPGMQRPVQPSGREVPIEAQTTPSIEQGRIVEQPTLDGMPRPASPDSGPVSMTPTGGGGRGLPPGVEQAGLEGFDPKKPSSVGGLVASLAKNLASVPGELIALKSSLSPPLLRQGKVRLVTHPIEAGKEFIQSFRAITDEGAEKALQAVKSDPWLRQTEGSAGNTGYTWFDVGKKDAGGATGRDLNAGLDQGFLGIGSRPEEREIVKQSWLGDRIRNSRVIKSSDRQAVAMLNAMRGNWYKEVAQQMWEAGERDITEYRKLRQFIEQATQRGSWSQGDVPLFFSTRALSGRAQALWTIAKEVPAGVATGRIRNAGVHQQALRSLVGMVAANTAQLGIMSALGLGVIEMSGGLPTIRNGAHHLDPWAGWNQQAKLILGVGKDITENLGDVLEGKGWEGVTDDLTRDMVERILHFGRGGLSPFYSTLVSAGTGEDFAGKPYKLSDELKESLKGGGLLSDWTAPIALEEIIEAYRESGAGAAALTSIPTLLSEGTSTYKTTSELRDDAARAAGVDTGITRLGPVQISTESQYQTAGPQRQAEIDQTQEVSQFREENPSQYQLDKQRLEAKIPAIVEAPLAEQRFLNGTLDRPIREYWKEESQSRRDLAIQLSDRFEREFAGFDRSKYEKAVEAYFNIDGKDEFGNPDFDVLEANRQAWFEKQPADVQQWIDESLQVSRAKKSPLHQEYLDFIDKKDTAGYFREGIEASERAALDRANPELDVQSWRFGGGLKDQAGPALQSSQAVDQAISLNLPNRPVKLANTPRPINQSDGSLAAWEAQKGRLAYYQDAGSTALKNSVSSQMFKVPYDKLDKDDQERVRNAIRNDFRKDPANQAMLVWWGISEKPANNQSFTILKDLVNRYGPLYQEP